MKKILILFLFFPIIGFTQNICDVYGAIKFVDFGEDYKIRFVALDEDYRVKYVDINFRETGKWKIVDYGEDFKVKIVDYGEDFKVKIVDLGEGCSKIEKISNNNQNRYKLKEYVFYFNKFVNTKFGKECKFFL